MKIYRQFALPLFSLLIAVLLAMLVFVVIQNRSLENRIVMVRNQDILMVCQGINQRHASTISELLQLDARYEAHATAAQKHQIAQSQAYTVLLIDRLLPMRNCQQVLRQQLHP